MHKIAVFCSGFGSNFGAIIDAVGKKKLRVEIAVMVCDNPAAYAIQRAKKNNIPVVLVSSRLFTTRLAYEKVVVRILKSQQIDLVVLAGFMRILTSYFIKSYRDKIINIHPSYLPQFKGAHAIRDAFGAKLKETGVSVHFVTEKVDSGKIILQEKVKISPKDTLESLEKKIHAVEHRLYPKAIQRVVDSKKQ